MDKDDFFIRSQIESNIREISELLNTGVFGARVLRPFYEPTFVSIILKLNDLLQKFHILNKRISFSEDISSGDITDLVHKVRDAISHPSSGENLLDKETQTKFVFNMLVGKVNAMQIGENIVAKSDYQDDIAFYYGEHRIYLNRHIVRVLKEANKIVRELYPNDPTI